MADISIGKSRWAAGPRLTSAAIVGADTSGTAGTSATINAPAGRCKLESTETAFTLSNSLIKSDSIVGYAVESSAGEFIKQVAVSDGQAVFTLDGASASDLTFAWWIVGY